MMNIPDKLSGYGDSVFAVYGGLSRKLNVVNLTQGYPDFDADTRLKELMAERVHAGHNYYALTGGIDELRKEIAALIESTYGKRIDPIAELNVTAGATQAISTVVSTFVSPGDEVILIEPSYESYQPLVELFGGKAVHYRTEPPDFGIDWERFRSLLSPRTRMIMLNTPNNPTGITYKAEDWAAIAEIVRGTDILLMSDEVYEHCVFDGQSHQSILRFPELWERSLAIFSLGKTFHITGWRVGYIVAPPDLLGKFRKVHQHQLFSVSAPAQYALADYMHGFDGYAELARMFERKRDLLAEGLAGTRFRLLPSEGGFFQLVDYSEISDETDAELAMRLIHEYGIGTLPLSAFYSGEVDARVLRLSFARKDETLVKAVEVLRGFGA